MSLRGAMLLAVAGVVVFSFWLFSPELRRLLNGAQPATAAPQALKVAVLGDSDSHFYGDYVDGKRRGNDYHAYTFVWTDIWARLRPGEVDLGALAHWGSDYRLARGRQFLGLSSRAPHKYDYENSYAVSGLKCRSLLQSWPYQARWLVDRVRANTSWNEGLVVIRIGVNDIGQLKHQREYAETGYAGGIVETVESCIAQIREAASSLLSANPSLRIALVGLARDYNLTMDEPAWSNKEWLINIDSVLTEYDRQLKDVASENPRIAFINDFGWHVDRVGSRLVREPASYFAIGNVKISNTLGDHPSNLVLADYHAGTIYHGLWLNHLIAQLNVHFDLGLGQLADSEIVQLIEGALG